ncbi:pyridoxamine 5'-phosphate oxidase family protein [Tianweitania sediminis]|jgi:general stress protein 26|uniref:Pyridoxamine 5'-phosphate oxidase family protein n=1 Tax=Tianweitania sediminis TaxID=1502156 RepID=A0A8J7UJ68_9HYPH|nr:pyridoxamine 5'-phosphate oxidase family protein [Tianweitania sediminis]MBP0439698.1 pyridoxamine 5'-phosphate oxidase family protein [Tianweitania sediminis]HEV7416316.1 pyridoxamine 5'-phosphate oxidase family protein [Tianweitania sediminis]
MKDKQEFWSMLKSFKVVMVATHDGQDIRSRPMAPHFDDDGFVVRFLSERQSGKTTEINEEHHINLTFANESTNDFASLSGVATQSQDRAMIKELWNAYADAWFDGDAETADVVVISFRPTEGQYWDSTGSSILHAFEIVRTKVTGGTPNVGEHGKVNFGR